jgi:nucleoside-diphosphate-sugar epimerase
MKGSLLRPPVLITGGCGRIGTLLAKGLTGPYALTLLDIQPPPPDLTLPFVRADIADFAAIRPHFTGVDTVIHLAANPRSTARWDDLLPANVIGLQNVFQAASEAGCRRVIFASSIMAVQGYPPEVQVDAAMLPQPATLYGVTKAWGETLAGYYARQGQLSVICIRIGWLISPRARNLTPDNPHLDWVVTPRDLLQLFQRCLDAPDEVKFTVVHGLSNNCHLHFDLAEARRLFNYAPQDDGFALAQRNYPAIIRRLGRIWRRARQLLS